MSTFSFCDSVSRRPSPDGAPGGSGEAVVLRGVGLRFKRYADKRPMLKQTVLNAIFGRKYSSTNDFWIFRNFDLSVRHGQRLGIIGSNGAGKSTLLKLMCGIYRASEGQVCVAGRIAPLIELGAGFNPELSGVENVFLNGALLGFSAGQMDRKVGRIIEFAGLEEFARTPIKYYSTGMLMRLAFAVATDIEPEVLLVDEIFAGGDAEFVAKAKARMNRLMDDSHVVVLVSHELKLIREMCNRAIWLDHGKVRMDGQPEEVCREYLAAQTT